MPIVVIKKSKVPKDKTTWFLCTRGQLPSEVIRYKVGKSIRCSAIQRVTFLELLWKQLFHDEVFKMPCNVFMEIHSDHFCSYHSLGIIVFNCFTFEEVDIWEFAMSTRGCCTFIRPIIFLLHARIPQFDLVSMSAQQFSKIFSILFHFTYKSNTGWPKKTEPINFFINPT